MYCSLGQNQFFDDAGAPLSAGRVKIFAKGSDTLLPIYEDNGDGFVPAQNPVITANDGRIPTVFWPAALVDVKVEKSNGDGTYTELDTYVAGMDASGSYAGNGVGTISDLRSLTPSAGMCVNVDGYYIPGDCPSRRYLWVENDSSTDDGGYVIASSVNSGGRWIMMWEGGRLPASLYGVMCGHGSNYRNDNVNSLFTLGKSVSAANSVYIDTPEIIDFDGRMYGEIDGTTPVSYGLDNMELTTVHRVAVSAAHGSLTVTASNLCTIHCSGFRGDNYALAAWLIDQYWSNTDLMERISSRMFAGLSSTAVHDAFMACVACSRVFFIDLYQNLHSSLTGSDNFQGKVVTDFVGTSVAPVYLYNYVIYPKTGIVFNTGIKVSVDAEVGQDLYVGRNLSVTGDINAGGDIDADGAIHSDSNILAEGYVKGSGYKLNSMDVIKHSNSAPSPLFQFGAFIGYSRPFGFDLTQDNTVGTKRTLWMVSQPVDLTTDIDVYNIGLKPSNFGLGSMVIIMNTASTQMPVTYRSNDVEYVQPYSFKTFIKKADSPYEWYYQA